MSKISISKEFNCPIEKAFDYVSDVDNRPQWQRVLNEVRRITPAPDHEGTRWDEPFKVLGINQTARMSYTKFERPTLFVEDCQLQPLCTAHVDMIFEDTNNGCRMTVAADMRWMGFFKLLAPLLTGAFKKAVRQDLEDIKSILESS